MAEARISFIRLIEAAPRESAREHSSRVGELVSAIDGLPGRTKVLLGLVYQESCSFAEAALVLGISEEEARESHASALAELFRA
jgi:DNA-directed RNA polymerase specialized sigma subunit